MSASLVSLTAGALALIFTVGRPIASAVAAGAFIIGTVPLFPLPVAYLSQLITKHHRGKFLSFNVISVTLPLIPAAWIGAKGIDAFGYRYMFIALAATAFTGFLLLQKTRARA